MIIKTNSGAHTQSDKRNHLELMDYVIIVEANKMKKMFLSKLCLDFK